MQQHVDIREASTSIGCAQGLLENRVVVSEVCHYCLCKEHEKPVRALRQIRALVSLSQGEIREYIATRGRRQPAPVMVRDSSNWAGRPTEGHTMRKRTGGYGITCPHCRSKFAVGGYSPGLIRCGHCGKTFNLR